MSIKQVSCDDSIMQCNNSTSFDFDFKFDLV
jgi:hypothetical protein